MLSLSHSHHDRNGSESRISVWVRYWAIKSINQSLPTSGGNWSEFRIFVGTQYWAVKSINPSLLTSHQRWECAWFSNISWDAVLSNTMNQSTNQSLLISDGNGYRYRISVGMHYWEIESVNQLFDLSWSVMGMAKILNLSWDALLTNRISQSIIWSLLISDGNGPKFRISVGMHYWAISSINQTINLSWSVMGTGLNFESQLGCVRYTDKESGEEKIIDVLLEPIDINLPMANRFSKIRQGDVSGWYVLRQVDGLNKWEGGLEGFDRAVTDKVTTWLPVHPRC